MSSFFYQTLVSRLSEDKSRYPLLKLNDLLDFTDIGGLLRKHKQPQRKDARCKASLYH